MTEKIWEKLHTQLGTTVLHGLAALLTEFYSPPAQTRGGVGDSLLLESWGGLTV